jgi:hypothetical protein
VTVRLVVNLRHFRQFHSVDAALAALAFGHKVQRANHYFRDFMLRQAHILPRRNEPSQKSVIVPRELGSPCFARFPTTEIDRVALG